MYNINREIKDPPAKHHNTKTYEHISQKVDTKSKQEIKQQL
jgi:hypothetical protein